MQTETVTLLQNLINFNTITPLDNGCQAYIRDYLHAIGFQSEQFTYNGVENFWAVHKANSSEPLLVFLGHTDVVPIGDVANWTSPPFLAAIRDATIYGRGAVDMKGGIAAMLTACKRFIEKNPNYIGNIAFLLTSDEEGPAVDGVVKVVQELLARKVKIDYCLIGEPASREKLGDVVKFGARGSLNVKVKIFGLQGHIAYPTQTINPIHLALDSLQELIKTEWDLPPHPPNCTQSSLQLSNIKSGTGATNVVPPYLECMFNLRFRQDHNLEQLQQRIKAIFDKYNFKYTIDWNIGAKPFIAPVGKLYQVAHEAIYAHTGYYPVLNTEGGTSDGRFMAPFACEILEVGPSNKTAHAVNEGISIADLDKLSAIYETILTKLYS